MKKYIVGTVALVFSIVANANPCDGIDRRLSDTQKSKLEHVIAKEEKLAKIRILQSFRSGKWHIIYIENYVSDEPFLFYSDDPMTTSPITGWSGGATIYEEQEIKSWTLKNAPGIPENLANCFAWHVTMDRDQ